ncbi:MAG: signal peptide peptidase SppA [Deltaproteobacteria bacterium]|nr:signal peptide peptidase SppA [Deltaproteobacteria bacterium]
MKRHRRLAWIGWGAALALGLLLAAATVTSWRSGGAAATGERLGVVEVRGFIGDAAPVLEALRDFRKDADVKAVVLRVDSPGGLVAPSQEIHDEVKRTAAVKPVVASMGTLAASGGYYISAPATRIVANPGTATGSIGVVLKFQDVHLLLDRWGLRGSVVKSGPLKDAGSPFREMTKADKAVFQAIVDDIFAQFVDAVASGRRMDRAKVLMLADGRVYSGRQALQLGLVDRLGNFWEAVALAQELGKLKGEPRLEYRRKKTGSGVLRLVLGEDSSLLQDLEALSAGPLQYALPGW